MGGCRATSARQRVLRALTAAQKGRDERGVSAVEFALVLPLLVMLLFGVTTAGLAYNDKLSIANAVREGARLGAALDYHTAPGTWATSVQSRVQETYFNSANTLNTNQICVRLRQWSGSGWSTVSGAETASVSTGCGTVPTDPVATATNSCAVEVWVEKPAKISLLVFPDMNINIGAQSVAYYGLKAGVCTP
jgi:Flp pilus assembly protein TadG